MTGYSINLLLNYLKDLVEEVDLVINYFTSARTYIAAMLKKNGYSSNF